jgi:outer membrane autotransporter protein
MGACREAGAGSVWRLRGRSSALWPSRPGNDATSLARRLPQRQAWFAVRLLAFSACAAISVQAHADCNTAGTSVTCTSTGGTQSTTVGTGPGSTITSVTVQSGATISTTSASISIDHGTIDIAGTVTNSGNANGPYNTGPNTVEFNGNTTLTVQAGGVLSASGYNGTGEAINANNGGNTITNYGTISTLNSADMWFQNADSTPNVIRNYGTMTAGSAGTGTVLGASNSNIVVNFTNGAGGVVNGNLSLYDGADSVSLLAGSTFNGNISTGGGNDSVTIAEGAAVSGDIDGGTGSNTLTLTGSSGSSTLSAGLANFSSLIKTGQGAWTVSSSLDQLGSGSAVVDVQQGRLVLTGDSSGFSGTTAIQNNATLQIGSGGTAGSLQGSITDNGTLAIDRSDTYTLANSISGTGALQQNGSGVTVLSGSNTYGGATLVSAGVLRAAAANTFSAASPYTVDSGATLDLAGHDQSVAALSNAGTVSLRGTTAGTTLSVSGNYVGNGGTLVIGAARGGSGIEADRLVVGGNVSGSTTLKVVNEGGLGTATAGNGVEVVAVTGTSSADAFALPESHISAGAYQYYLYKGDVNGAGDNWFLRSYLPGSSSPVYRQEVSLYSALPAQISQADLLMLGDYHQREGDSAAIGGGSGLWVRAINADMDIRQSGTVAPSSSLRLNGLQIGADLWRRGNWRAGAYVGYLYGHAQVSGTTVGGNGTVGRNTLDGGFLGGYGTYLAANGWYADMVLQGAWHAVTLDSADNGSSATSSPALSASIELGRPITVGNWQIEPQVQAVRQWLHAENSRISGDTTVSRHAAGVWLARVGLRFTTRYRSPFGRLQPYAGINLYRSSSNDCVSTFSTASANTSISAGMAYTSTRLAGGATLALTDQTSVYGEVGRLWAGSSATEVSAPIQASLGIRTRW